MICCKLDEIFEMGFGLVRRGVKGFRSKVFSAHPLSVYLPGSGQFDKVKNLTLCAMLYAPCVSWGRR
jgi:hypothetical protein